MVDSDNIAWRDIEGEILLMRLKDGAVFSMEETSAFIWRLLETGSQDEEYIASQICAEFDVDPETARTDVKEFISDMMGAELIKTM